MRSRGKASGSMPRCSHIAGRHAVIAALLLLTSAGQVVATEQDAAISAPFVVQLRRESKASAEGVEKSFYVATAVVGDAEPGEKQQEFDVVFDLGSGQIVLPASRCNSKACLEHRRYDKWGSKKAVDIQANGHPVLEEVAPQPALRKSGTSPMHGKKVVRDLANIGVDFLDLGSGQVKGELIRDRFCLTAQSDSQARCVELGLVVATELTDLPFCYMPNDGIVGLGLEGLTIGRDFGFLTKFGDRLAPGGAAHLQFGLFLGSNGGEIVFGGYDAQRVAASAPLMWSPVAAPEKGFWQVKITAVRVGGTTLPLCTDGECRGAVETGASHFSLSDELGLGLEDALREAGARGSENRDEAEAVGADGQVIPARRERGFGEGLVNVELLLEGGGMLTLQPEDYVSRPECVGEPETCRPLIERHSIPEELGRSLFVLGESVLRRYYTVFDWGEKRIGFGLAAGRPSNAPTTKPRTEASAAAVSTASVTSKPAKKNGFLGTTPSGTILLLQVQTSMKSIKA